MSEILAVLVLSEIQLLVGCLWAFGMTNRKRKSFRNQLTSGLWSVQLKLKVMLLYVVAERKHSQTVEMLFYSNKISNTNTMLRPNWIPTKMNMMRTSVRLAKYLSSKMSQSLKTNQVFSFCSKRMAVRKASRFFSNKQIGGSLSGSARRPGYKILRSFPSHSWDCTYRLNYLKKKMLQ